MTDSRMAALDNALGLAPLFFSLPHGRTTASVPVEVVQVHGQRRIIWRAPCRLPVSAQSVLLACLAVARGAPRRLDAAPATDVGRALRDGLQLDGSLQAQPATSLLTTATALARRAGMGDGGAVRARLRRMLELLAQVSLTVAGHDGMDGSSRLLAWTTDATGSLRVALAPCLLPPADATASAWLGSGLSLVDVDARAALGCPKAMLIHARYSTQLRPGHRCSVGHARLESLVWGSVTTSPSTRRGRDAELRQALGRLGALDGWSVEPDITRSGRRASTPRPVVTIARARAAGTRDEAGRQAGQAATARRHEAIAAQGESALLSPCTTGIPVPRRADRARVSPSLVHATPRRPLGGGEGCAR